jgi:hypothetical protein
MRERIAVKSQTPFWTALSIRGLYRGECNCHYMEVPERRLKPSLGTY